MAEAGIGPPDSCFIFSVCGNQNLYTIFMDSPPPFTYNSTSKTLSAFLHIWDKTKEKM